MLTKEELKLRSFLCTLSRDSGFDQRDQSGDAAVSDLEDAVIAVKDGDVAAVNSNLSAAMTDYGTCNMVLRRL
ncbi:unnamed protein product [Eruca vesicaria subsp. sativa]|uniref:Uncharacterized protein n=1 Tax=Eruca vesicaria subsp. sativa TaxID=29727 RepID=A0ABC8IXI4_ERUVS|nr:unnamed protein product [Eruca vesicaria subsp. sativa]